jgi:hypothetical protein
MYTQMLYEAERAKTAREWREFNTRNGEIALAIRRPFRMLRTRVHSARRTNPQRPRLYGRPSLETTPFLETTGPQARCS